MARVLIVDDQKIPRKAVAAMLHESGHEVETAASGNEGLDRARSWLPDVIVLDVYMPDMDGFEVVEALKKDAATAPTPVIFLTAEAPTDELIVRGLDLGAYDFLSKGCSRAELLARVGVMARIKRANDELSAVARISDTLIQSLNPRDLRSRFLAQVAEVFRADGVLIAFTPKTAERRVLDGIGMDTSDPLAEQLADSLAERIVSADSEVLELDATELRGGAGVLVRRHRYGSAAATLIEHEDRPPTVLAVFSCRSGGFARGSDAALLHLIARQANIALDNASLHVQAREQAEALEKAISQRSRFFASMSHELRTPVNAVLGYNQLLEMGTFGELNEQQANAVENVDRSARHLLELINDILDISKIEAGKLEIQTETVDLAELVEDTVTTVALQADEKGLAIRTDLPETGPATTDPARVRQIVLNLLANAVKFTAEGEIGVTLHERPDRYEITVTDTGPGIPPEDRDRIFEEFEQSGGRGEGGTGLGLAISRRLAELLGGELRLETEVGVGSAFTLVLPR